MNKFSKAIIVVYLPIWVFSMRLSADSLPSLIFDGFVDKPLFEDYPERAAGNIYITAPTDSNLNFFGPIILWKSNKSPAIFEITDLASLNEVVSIELKALGPTSSEQDKRRLTYKVIGVYLSSRADRMILTGDRRERFLMGLKKAASKNEFAKIESLLKFPTSTEDSRSWRLDIPVRTPRAGLEVYSFVGDRGSCSIVTCSQKILLQDGEIPLFNFD